METSTTTRPVETARSVEERTAVLRDGTEVFYRHWPAREPSDKAVLLFHRGHEHSGRFQEMVDRLGMNDYSFFAWDARGHGRSPGERGYAPSFGHIVRDIDSFVRHVATEHDVAIENMAVVAHSVGAVAVAAWVHDYAPPIRAMVLATPAFRVKLYVPLAIPGLRLLQKIKGKAFIKSYVKSKMLTHDVAMAEDYASDQLISRNIAVNILLGLHDTATRILRDAGAIVTPSLIISAGSDWVVHERPQRQFFDRISSPVKEYVRHPNMYHAVFHEQDRQSVFAKIREFVDARFCEPSPTIDLLDADKHGYTHDVYEELRRPLSPLSPKRWYYAATRMSLNTLGRLSRGVSIGWQHGFDAGESLDHIYRNQAEGTTPLGRLFDRVYLSGPGWAGIRQRKENLQRVLDELIDETHAAGKPVRILDIAAGPGRYILETIKRRDDVAIEALLRDRDTSGLAAGRKIADEFGVTTATHEEGDAFDPESLGAVAPKPTIGIVSGLYELFPDNDLVRRSLKGLARAVEIDGFLVYTNQPWHPQQELIARSLPSLRGGPWVMRCRSQMEMDRLVADAGFEKIRQEIDDGGIFSVSVARRRDS